MCTIRNICASSEKIEKPITILTLEGRSAGRSFPFNSSKTIEINSPIILIALRKSKLAIPDYYSIRNIFTINSNIEKLSQASRYSHWTCHKKSKHFEQKKKKKQNGRFATKANRKKGSGSNTTNAAGFIGSNEGRANETTT